MRDNRSKACNAQQETNTCVYIYIYMHACVTMGGLLQGQSENNKRNIGVRTKATFSERQRRAMERKEIGFKLGEGKVDIDGNRGGRT